MGNLQKITVQQDPTQTKTGSSARWPGGVTSSWYEA